MSKSTVFPKPWQRGHAPYGLLNENNRGSGSWYTVPQFLHSKRSLKTMRSGAAAFGFRHEFQNGFAVPFAVANFHGIDQPRAHVWPDRQAVHDHDKRACEKSTSSSVSGEENSCMRPA